MSEKEEVSNKLKEFQSMKGKKASIHKERRHQFTKKTRHQGILLVGRT